MFEESIEEHLPNWNSHGFWDCTACVLRILDKSLLFFALHINFTFERMRQRQFEKLQITNKLVSNLFYCGCGEEWHQKSDTGIVMTRGTLCSAVCYNCFEAFQHSRAGDNNSFMIRLFANNWRSVMTKRTFSCLGLQLINWNVNSHWILRKEQKGKSLTLHFKSRSFKNWIQIFEYLSSIPTDLYFLLPSHSVIFFRKSFSYELALPESPLQC